MSIAVSAAAAVDRRPVATFGGFLMGIDAVLGFAQLRWDVFSADELAMLGPAITFAATVLWFPARGALGWLARRFPEPEE